MLPGDIRASVSTGAASTAKCTTPPCTLTLATPVTVQAGEPVSGPGVAAGTKVHADVAASTTLSLDTATTSAIPANTILVFAPAVSASTATLTSTCTSAACITLADPVTLSAGHPVSGPGVAAGTKVQTAVTAGTALTLNTATTADVPAGTMLLFPGAITAASAVLCASPACITLTTPVTLQAGEPVSGLNVAAGTKVATDVTASTTLPLDTAVTASIPVNTPLAFAPIAPRWPGHAKHEGGGATWTSPEVYVRAGGEGRDGGGGREGGVRRRPGVMPVLALIL